MYERDPLSRELTRFDDPEDGKLILDFADENLDLETWVLRSDGTEVPAPVYALGDAFQIRSIHLCNFRRCQLRANNARFSMLDIDRLMSFLSRLSDHKELTIDRCCFGTPIEARKFFDRWTLRRFYGRIRHVNIIDCHQRYMSGSSPCVYCDEMGWYPTLLKQCDRKMITLCVRYPEMRQSFPAIMLGLRWCELGRLSLVQLHVRDVNDRINDPGGAMLSTLITCDRIDQVVFWSATPTNARTLEGFCAAIAQNKKTFRFNFDTGNMNKNLWDVLISMLWGNNEEMPMDINRLNDVNHRIAYLGEDDQQQAMTAEWERSNPDRVRGIPVPIWISLAVQINRECRIATRWSIIPSKPSTLARNVKKFLCPGIAKEVEAIEGEAQPKNFGSSVSQSTCSSSRDRYDVIIYKLMIHWWLRECPDKEIMMQIVGGSAHLNGRREGGISAWGIFRFGTAVYQKTLYDPWNSFHKPETLDKSNWIYMLIRRNPSMFLQRGVDTGEWIELDPDGDDTMYGF